MGALFSVDALVGRRALVTGGTAGIGRAIAQGLSAAGASVVIADIDAATGPDLAAALRGKFVALDVTDGDAIDRVAAAVGPIDILVNNAGRDQHGYFVHSARDEWDALLSINLEAVLGTTRAFLPAMQERGWGRIVNIASEAGRIGSSGGSVYAAAKGGVIAFTKSIAREAARYGVTANVVCPGPIKTPMLDAAVEKGGAKLMAAMCGATLLGRLGMPEEVAAMAVFLASHQAGYITGETIGVSGGMGV